MLNRQPHFLAALLAGLCLSLVSVNTQAALDATLMEGLKARSIGPAAVSGRIAAIDVVASNPNHMVVGAATGGVWISDNGGLTWEPVFDDQPVASIGSVAINQSNPDIIWVGTGEGNVRNSTSIGGGIFKSVDGGKSWKRMGLAASERINRIALHPNNPDIVYVAAMGTLWGPNEERGVYKTSDGGQTWQQILYVDDSTGATDIKMDTVNPDKLYAGMWQFRRWPYFFKSGGEGSGMYISHDGGANWTRKTEEDGLPAGELGRMAFALSADDPNRVYALVEAKDSALLRSDDSGASWSKVNEEFNIADRPFYYTELAADPQNADVLYNIGTRVRVSIDGGKTFEANPVIDCCAPGNTIHIDNHAYWINPGNSDHIIFGNDGGLGITHDGGETFRFVRNLPLAQFYHIAVDNELPYNIYGGLQDNGSWRGPSAVWESAGIRNLHWQEVGFGDGFDTVPDPDNARSGYAMSQGGSLFRWNLDTGEQNLIKPDPPTPDTDLRFNWNAALAIDPFDINTIYYGSQFVHRSHDRGSSWQTISDDLTSNDPEMQTFRESGGLTYDVTAAENYTSIVSIAPSALERGVIWVGSDDGRINITQDGGENWIRIDNKSRAVPQGAWVPMITPSPHDASVAYVVFDDHRRSNMETNIFRVENYGKRWKKLSTNGISGYALSILQDPVDPRLLFAGTEFGLHVSTDDGDSWTKFTAGVPTVSVMDMAFQARENDLVLGTHGRSVFVIDDYSALRNLSSDDFDSRLQILSTSPGQQYNSIQTRSSRFTGSGEFRGDNQPFGVMITFMAAGDDLPHPDSDSERDRKIKMRSQQEDNAGDAEGDSDKKKKSDKPKVTVEVTDAGGELIRTYKTEVHQGINRIFWRLQGDGIKPVSDSPRRNADDGLPPGAMVLPGDYTVTLTLDDVKDSHPIEILKDPRSDYSLEDMQANFDARMSVQAMRNTINTALRQIISTRDDVNAISKLIGKKMKISETDDLKALKKQAGEVKKGLDNLEKLYRTPENTKGITYRADKVTSKLGMAGYYVGSSDGAPSPAAGTYISIAETAVADATEQVNEFMTTDVAELRESVAEAGITLLPSLDSVSMPD